LLQWAWASYERLGALSSGHPNDAQYHAVPTVALATDVCDLGRLFLRLLLQPHKLHALAMHPGNAGAAALEPPPSEALFPPSLKQLLVSMLSARPEARPTARQILTSPWMRQADEPTPRRLCPCWKLADAAVANVTPSDLRLIQRPLPPFRQLSLADSPAVTDEWLEALCHHHSPSLRRLDLSGCHSLSRTERPLRAIRRLQALETLRLPAELWGEHEIADTLAALPALTSLDEQTYQDLLKARDALRDQCNILLNVQL